jgi:dihydrofolate synthase/folylpolyglutamate synthase
LVAEPDNFADLIEPFSRRGVDLGLDRLQAALAELGHPERQFAAVQVAGTNGKGSICTLVHQALLAAGIRAGLYTSPHLVSWTERIRLGHAPIAAASLRQHLESATPAARRHQLTPFELVTAAAFLAFAAADLELVVLEVGLGGRLDATTCHPHRPVIGFASVGLDHAEFLGPDPATIAAEKAGVLQAGAVAISAPQSPEVAAVLSDRAAAVGAELRWVEPLDLDQWPLGLSGSVQAANGAVALGLLGALKERGWPINDTAIRHGFAAARWPGRLQQLNWHGLPLLLDGAHNLPAALALRAELDANPQRHGLAAGPRHWVLGVLANKQGPEIAAALLAPGDRAWIVPVPGHACWSLEALAAASPHLASQLHATPNLEAGLTQAGTSSGRVVVAGSLYLLGQLLTTIGSAAGQAQVASKGTSGFG